MATQNLIQIKRSETTATPPSLANGELAWSSNGNILYIGDFGSVVPIAGELNPGVLTANQALVANSTGSIDEIRTAELNLASFSVTSILDSDTMTGVSNTSLATSESIKAYVDAEVGSVVSSFTITGDTGSDTFATGQTLDFAGNVGITTAVTDNQVDIAVLANNGIIANNTGVYVDGANGISVTAAGVNVQAANSTVSVTASGIAVAEAQLSIASSQLSTDVALGTQTSGNYVATLSGGAGLTGSGTGEGSTPTLAVGAGVGVTVNADDVAVNAQDGLIANTSGLFVDPGTGVTVNSTGVHIGQSVGTGDNVTFNDVTVSGDLTVSGNVVSIDVSTLSVEDPLIELAKNNAADAVDIGFYGQYDDTGTKYAGLFRDASDGSGVFKLFAGLGTEPTTTVGDVTSLLADLDVGGLYADSLALGTDLAVTHGGTGKSSVTTNAVLYGQGTSALAEATGSAYQVLQLNASGVPVFDSLDGGTF